MPEISDEEFAELTAAKEKAAEADKRIAEAEKYKTDMLKYKEDSKAKADKLAEIEREKAEAEKAGLAQKEEYKTLAEKLEKELQSSKENEAKSFKAVKSFVVKKEILAAGKDAGMVEEALKDPLLLLTAKDLEVKRDGDDISVLGVGDFIKEQKKLRPHWFSDQKPLNINDPKGGKAGKQGPMSWSELRKLQHSDKKEDRQQYKEYMANIGKT